MKKFLAIAVAFTLFLFLTGCSSDTQEPNDNVTQKTAEELAKAVLNSVEFPQTVNVTDKDIIGDMGIDLSLTDDYAVIQQMLSVDVVEIIILKVKDGNMEQVIESLQNRKDSLINDFAFYPGQVEAAEATVVGKKWNVAYLICHKDAGTAEKTLLEEIG